MSKATDKHSADDVPAGYVFIKKGSYRNIAVEGQTFRLHKPLKPGKKGLFVTVIGNGSASFPKKPLRITVASKNDIATPQSLVEDSEDSAQSIVIETDEQIVERIRERFDILQKMTIGAMNGDVRALIVTGPPGVGKTYEIEHTLQNNELYTSLKGKPRFEIVKGVISPLGLYCKLYEYASENSVVVFDDCDDVWKDENAINILKAALDSSKKRHVSWNTDSHKLDRDSVPNRFEFCGSVIFVTNLNFEVSRKSLRAHIEALESRCHVIDLAMPGAREKLLRIRQIVGDGMLKEFGLKRAEVDELLDFLNDNQLKMRELSLRTILKLASLRKADPKKWQNIARITCMKNRVGVAA